MGVGTEEVFDVEIERFEVEMVLEVEFREFVDMGREEVGLEELVLEEFAWRAVERLAISWGTEEVMSQEMGIEETVSL